MSHQKIHALAGARLWVLQTAGQALKLYYPLNDDPSGMQYNLVRGHRTGVQYLTQQEGLVDYAIGFSSNGGYVRDFIDSISNPAEATVSALYWRGADTQDSYYDFGFDSGGEPRFEFGYYNSPAQYQAKAKLANGTTATLTLANSKLEVMEWHLVTMTWKQAGNFKLFLDGREVASATQQNSPLSIGSTYFGVNPFAWTSFPGFTQTLRISDLFYAEKELTPTQVWDLFTRYITAAPVMKTDSV